MCGICGCNTDLHDHDHDHDHDHEHAPNPNHDHDHQLLAQTISIQQNILAKNNQFAQTNRDYFANRGLLAINLMSSPGTGKTTLLAKTITDLYEQRSMAVIVGDQQTDYDAKHIQATGIQAIQINTGHVCHLDAHRVGHAVEAIDLPRGSILFIENVGNLVCPALFDLGESVKVVMLSVTEGDNKPLKYPDMFLHADLLLLTKMDLLPYVDFDIEQCIANARKINPTLEVCQLSAKTGVGLTAWYQWLLTQST